jgi:hypothetical protein
MLFQSARVFTVGGLKRQKVPKAQRPFGNPQVAGFPDDTAISTRGLDSFEFPFRKKRGFLLAGGAFDPQAVAIPNAGYSVALYS